MQALYFSPRDCWPVTTGARLRDFHLAREVARDCQLTYLGFQRPDSAETAIRRETLPALGAEVILVPRRSGYGPAKIVRGLLGPAPISVLNYQSSLMTAELRRLLHTQHFDLVQMEGIHLFAYLDLLREGPGAPRLISDWHNIESELMGRYAENSPSMPRKLYARRTAYLLRRLELTLLRRCDAHVVCSEREKQLLLARVPTARIVVVGNGVDVESHADTAIEEACRQFPGLAGDGQRSCILFVGSMDYHANIDAALFFAREIWPLIRAARPDLEFLIVGSRPTAEIVSLGGQAGISVTGTVKDVRPFYRRASMVVIPARVASGTRLKALEAMAAGVPVVSTTLGVEGLDITPGENAVLADAAEDFAKAVLSLRPETREWERLSEGGRRFVAAHYDWAHLGRTLRALYAEQLREAAA